VLLVAGLSGVLGARVQAQTGPGTDPVRLMAEGNQAYTQGDLDLALQSYLQAADLGVNDAGLHFNLGNTYARSGQLGQAVACYLRAKVLDPGDKDIASNLAWVRRHIRDLELNQEPLPLFVAQAAGVMAALSVNQWGVILALGVWLTSGLVGWALYRGEFGVRLRRVVLVAMGTIVVLAAVTGWRWYQDEARDLGVVVDSAAAVRSGPAESFPVLFEVHDGLTVDIKEYRENWVRVGLGGEWVGWLPAASVVAVRGDSAGISAGFQGR
jgi:tetratricopeptide (TPR) repeat protein